MMKKNYLFFFANEESVENFPVGLHRNCDDKRDNGEIGRIGGYLYTDRLLKDKIKIANRIMGEDVIDSKPGNIYIYI